MRAWSRRSLRPVPGSRSELFAGDGIWCIEVESGSQDGIRLALEDGHESWSGQVSIPLFDRASIPLGGMLRTWIVWPSTASTGTNLVLTVWHQPQASYIRKVGGTEPVSVAALPLPSGAATETTLASVLAALGPLATETTLASVLAALGPLATETTLASVLAALGPLATETTLASVLAALGPLATETTLGNVLSALATLITTTATETTLASVLAAVSVKPQPTYQILASGINVAVGGGATIWIPGAATSWTLNSGLTPGGAAGQLPYSRLLLYVGHAGGTSPNSVALYTDAGLGGAFALVWDSNLRGSAGVPVGTEGLVSVQELPVPHGAFRLALIDAGGGGTFSYQVMGVRN